MASKTRDRRVIEPVWGFFSVYVIVFLVMLMLLLITGLDFVTAFSAVGDMTLSDLKQFRQWESRTPGHPEYGMTPGVETTTGPLGQGVAAQGKAGVLDGFGHEHAVARGEAGPDSDIDFLVDMERDRSLFDVGGLLMELQDLLGQRAQVVTENSLHWYIHDQVLIEAKPL